MTKTGKMKILLLSAAAVLIAAFLAVLFLSMPLGGQVAVLSVTVFYAVGGSVAGVFLVAGALLLFLSKKGG